MRVSTSTRRCAHCGAATSWTKANVMSEYRRYLDDEATDPLASTLLRSASHDGLDEARFAELARAAAARRSEMVTAVSEPLARRATPSGFPGTKWGVLAVIAALALGGVMLARTGDDGPRPTTGSESTTTPPPSVEPHAPETPASEAVPVALLPQAPVASETPRPREPAPRAPAVPPAQAITPDDDSLAAEVRALERVRSALAEHRVADARAGLASWERAFPKRLLANEARVLGIEVLFADGRRKEAETRARAFLAAAPDSPYAPRIRALLESPDP
ncbi:MAG: hypothetical protein K0S65_6178 [Labilithrix sp.]|nr:hypothetical protein [Labilithrix sp.]